MARKKEEEPKRDALTVRQRGDRVYLVSEPIERIRVSDKFLTEMLGQNMGCNEFTLYASNGDPVTYVYERTVESGRTWYFRRKHSLEKVGE